MIIHIFNKHSSSWHYLKQFNELLDSESNEYYICGNFEQVNMYSPSLMAFKKAVLLDYSKLKTDKKSFKALMKRLKSASTIFLYGMLSLPDEILKIFAITKDLLPKSVWVVNNTDFIAPKTESNSSKKDIIAFEEKRKRLIFLRRHISLVVCTELHQKTSIENLFGRTYNICYIPRPIPLVHSLILDSVKNKNSEILTSPYNVLLGHSSYKLSPYIIQSLYAFVDDINIIFQTSKQAKWEKANKTALHYYKFSSTIIDDNISTKEYVKLLKSISIAIFDTLTPDRVYCVMVLLYLGKQVFFSTKSNIFDILKTIGLKINSTKALGNFAFHDLICPSTQNENSLWLQLHLNYSKNANLWKFFIQDVAKCENLELFAKENPDYLQKFIGDTSHENTSHS